MACGAGKRDRRFRLVCRVVMCIQGVQVPYGPLMTQEADNKAMQKPDCHSERLTRGEEARPVLSRISCAMLLRPWSVDPTRPGEEGASYLERSPLWSAHI